MTYNFNSDPKDPKIMKYIPESKKEAISAAWKDSDGYWIELNRGWNADRTDYRCHVIHEDTINELRYQITGIARNEEEMAEIEAEEKAKAEAEEAAQEEQDIIHYEGYSIVGNDTARYVGIDPQGNFSPSSYDTVEEAKKAIDEDIEFKRQKYADTTEKVKEENTMKEIIINDKNRTEVARAINFNTYPVLTLDLADRDEYGLKGCKVRIDNGTFSTGDKYYVHATLRAWRDEKYFSFSSRNTCLHKDFTYSDVEEMLEWAKAPIIGKDQEVAIVVYDSSVRAAFAVYIVRTGNVIRPNCIDPLEIEKVDLNKYFRINEK